MLWLAYPHRAIRVMPRLPLTGLLHVLSKIRFSARRLSRFHGASGTSATTSRGQEQTRTGRAWELTEILHLSNVRSVCRCYTGDQPPQGLLEQRGTMMN